MYMHVGPGYKGNGRFSFDPMVNRIGYTALNKNRRFRIVCRSSRGGLKVFVESLIDFFI